MGANLALQKPISMDRAVRSLRAAHVLVVSERRRFYRHKIEMPVTVMIETTEIQATATDLSEGGLALRVTSPLPVGSPVQVRFKLPGSNDWISANALVVWADAENH